MYHFLYILFTLLMSRLIVVGSTSLCGKNIPHMSLSKNTIMVKPYLIRATGELLVQDFTCRVTRYS